MVLLMKHLIGLDMHKIQEEMFLVEILVEIITPEELRKEQQDHGVREVQQVVLVV